MDAELAPIRLGKIDAVVLRGLLDVRERYGAIGIGNVGHLVEPGDCISHMCSISQWLFPLPSKGFAGQLMLTEDAGLTWRQVGF